MIESAECQGAVCPLGKKTGVSCPPDSCDLEDGVRELPPPNPTYTLTISIGACEWPRLLERLFEVIKHWTPEAPAGNSCWGGAGTHGHVSVEHRPEVTLDAYKKALHEWWMEGKVSRDVREEVREHGAG